MEEAAPEPRSTALSVRGSPGGLRVFAALAGGAMVGVYGGMLLGIVTSLLLDTLGFTSLPAPLVILGVSGLLTLSLLVAFVRAVLPPRFRLGIDELHIQLGNRSFELPLRSVRAAIVPTPTGQTLSIGDERSHWFFTPLSTSLSSEDFERLHEQLTKAIEWRDQHQLPALAAELDQGARSLQDWSTFLQMLVSTPGYRGRAITAEELSLTLRSPRSNPSQRVAAAWLLLRLRGEAGRVEVRSVAEHCLHTRTRRALGWLLLVSTELQPAALRMVAQ